MCNNVEYSLINEGIGTRKSSFDFRLSSLENAAKVEELDSSINHCSCCT